MEISEDKLELILSKLEDLDNKLNKVLKEVEYTDAHAFREYLLNVGGDLTGDVLMNFLFGK